MSYRDMELTFLLLCIVGVGIYCIYIERKLNKKVAYMDKAVSENNNELGRLKNDVMLDETHHGYEHTRMEQRFETKIINEAHPGSYVVEFGNKRLFPQQLSGLPGISEAISQAFGKEDKTDYSYKAMLDFVKTRPELSKDNIKEVKRNAAE